MNKETFNRLKKVNDIFSEIDFTYHEIARQSGLSDSEFNVLYTLCELGNGCLLSLAYKHNGTSRQTIESAVRKLEKNELMYLQAGEGRKKTMWLTPKGETLVEEKIKPILKMEEEILSAWQEEELVQYLHLNQKYLDDLRQKFNEYNRSK